MTVTFSSSATTTTTTTTMMKILLTMAVFLLVQQQQGMMFQQHKGHYSCCCTEAFHLSSSSRPPAATRMPAHASFIVSQQPRSSKVLQRPISIRRISPSTSLSMSDWSTFQALEDDDEDEDIYANADDDTTSSSSSSLQQYANENDPQEYKAQVGSNIPAPSIDWEGEPIFLPQGSILPLSEENVQGVLAACRQEIGTMFGYSAENRGVGITGGVDFVDLDGPTVILKLHGRFWHQRTTVLERVGKYLQGRIPEIVDYAVEDPWELTDEANDVAY
jgi:hypothetical protein